MEIEKTTDKDTIKRAYRNKLKVTRPDDDMDKFIELRDAYEQAMTYAKNYESYEEYNEKYDEEYVEEYDEEYVEEYDEEYDEYEDSEDYEAVYFKDEDKNKKVIDWNNRVLEVYNDYNKRNDISEWKKLLYDDIPYSIEYYDVCRMIINRMLMRRRNIYIARKARVLIDDFFSFCGTSLERSQSLSVDWLREVDKKFKLNENIEFYKLIPSDECISQQIDDFFEEYEELADKLVLLMNDENMKDIKESVNKLLTYPLYYLPLDCLNIYINCFKDYSSDEINDMIGSLRKINGEQIEIDVLEAQYRIYQKDIESARKILKNLYKNAPVKNAPALIQMIRCCKEANMYYEAYMLVKMLTWLNPKPYMYDMAEEICGHIEKCYIDKIENNVEISDLEHIHMCRIYLRSNREDKAIEVLDNIKDATEYLWEYEVAHAMCTFYEEEKTEKCNLYGNCEGDKPGPIIEITRARAIFEKLENYPKEILSTLDLLEWQELRGRYLFEQRRYDECDSLCNELLKEYPLSYPILMLRGYADYGKNCLGSHGMMNKKYLDFTFLIRVMPKRVEARLVSAQILSFRRRNADILKIIKPIKNNYPDHYMYYKIYDYEMKEDDKFLEGILKILKKSTECKLSIPPTSKYRLLDLRNIFAQACYYCDETNDAVNVMNFLAGLENSSYNSPDKYIDKYNLYKEMNRYEEAEKVLKKELENARNHDEEQSIYKCLVQIYAAADNFVEAEHYFAHLDKEYKIECGGSLGRMAYRLGEYEKAVYYFSIVYKNPRRLTINTCMDMGKAYEKLERYDEAVWAYREGIIRCDKSGDCYTGENAYYEIYKIYDKLGKLDGATQALEEMRDNTKNPDMHEKMYDSLFWLYQKMKKFYEARKVAYQIETNADNPKIRRKRSQLIGLSSLCLTDFETSYKYYMDYLDSCKVEGVEVPFTDLVNIFLAAYAVGSSEATDLALELAHSEDTLNEDFLISALRNEFMICGKVNKALADKIEQELLSCEQKPYKCLIEVSAALGKEEQMAYYKNERAKYEEDETEVVLEAWIYAYKGDYKNAYMLYDSVEEYKDFLMASNFYIEYLFFKRMVEG